MVASQSSRPARCERPNLTRWLNSAMVEQAGNSAGMTTAGGGRDPAQALFMAENSL